ncbi:MAG: hypothetical protein L0Y79_02910 [Chlorobi bacterium]|nr:hypothetical protein [Chlorobiota bacterium]MCI0715076.1 hypothetical protein [Chlorobiota bacterium]
MIINKIILLLFILYLSPVSSQEYKTLEGHRGNVNSISYSPDSKFIASADENGVIIFWEAESYTRIYSLETTSNVTCVNYSTDGYFAYTTYDGYVTIMKANNREIVQNFRKDGNCYYVSYSGSGKKFALAYVKEASKDEREKGLSKIFYLDIYGVPGYEKIKTLKLTKPGDSDGSLFGSKLFETYRADFFNCEFSTSGDYIASGNLGKSIPIYSFEYSKFVPPYKGHSEKVNFVTFSQDGKFLASAGKDETIKIWDIISAKSIKTLKGHTNEVNFASFSPDSRYLASAGNDETVKIWDVKTTNLIVTLSCCKF